MSPLSRGLKLKKAQDLLEAGDFTGAMIVYAALVDQHPQAVGEYGHAAAESGDFELANRLWKEFRSRNAKDVVILTWLAAQYGRIGFNTAARELWLEVSNLQPGNLQLKLKLASILVRTCSVADARPTVNQCLELSSGDVQARCLSARLDRRENKITEAEQCLREILGAQPRLPEVRYSIHAELAHIMDQTGRHGEAIVLLEEGKNALRQAVNFPTDWRGAFAQPEFEVRRIASVPKDVLRTWGRSFPADTHKPAPPLAFLTGATRSGTTLLERVLDAHSGICALDECMAFQKIHP